ncbi:MAG: hypothetical protein ACT4O5_05505 [Gammaproteobacteria bacterium]
MRTVFYAWQSETPHDANRDFIAGALDAAVRALNLDLELVSADEGLVLDRDVRGVPGMAPIADTILEKIKASSVCAMDLTIVATNVGRRQRGIPNSNVLIELGFALAARGPEVIVCIMNEHFGHPDDLPFDLRHRNVPVRYNLRPHATPLERERQLAELTAGLTETLRLALQKRPESAGAAAHVHHAAAPMDAHVFGDIAAFELARTRSRDLEGRFNERVYWHDGPTAWLRLLPTNALSLTRADITDLAHGEPSLETFGSGLLTRRIPNERGLVAIAFEGSHPTVVADRITQLFRTGELWGLNRALLRQEAAAPRNLVMSWTALRATFEQTLTYYMAFARGPLQIRGDVILIAGVARVTGAILAVPGMREDERPRCLEPMVRVQMRLTDLDGDPAHLLSPFWTALWDACGMKMPTASREGAAGGTAL